MLLTPLETCGMIAAVALGAMATRFTPFLLFPENKTPPAVIVYLGRVLPAAMMGLLVVYCLREIDFTAAPFGAAELLAVSATVLLHRWKGNTLLSIAGGTALYMLLVQVVFA